MFPALLGLPSAGSLAEDLVKDALSAITKLAAEAAEKIMTALVAVIDSTTTPIFSSGWWSGPGTRLFAIVSALSAGIAIVALMLAALEGIWSGTATPIVKAIGALPSAILKTVLLVPLTSLLVSGTDQVATSFVSAIASQLGAVPLVVGADLVDADAVGLVIAGLIVLAVLAVWAELALRAALIYLVVMTAPMVVMASVHPRLRQSWARFAEFGVALILSKVVIALAIAVGFSELTASGSRSFGQAVGALVAALATLGVACFAPYVLFRLISVEMAHLEGLSRRPVRAVQSTQQLTAGSRQGLNGFLGRFEGRGLTDGGPAGAAPPRPPASPSSPPDAGRGPAGGGAVPVTAPGSTNRPTRSPTGPWPSARPAAATPPAPPDPAGAGETGRTSLSRLLLSTGRSDA